MNDHAPLPGGLRNAGLPLRLEIYDPPMCCSSGLCGPVVDPTLLAVNEALLALAKQGVDIVRLNPVQHLKEVMANPEVAKALHRQGKRALPMIFANGHLVRSGAYPTYEELCQALGLQPLSTSRPLPVLTAMAQSAPSREKE